LPYDSKIHEYFDVVKGENMDGVRAKNSLRRSRLYGRMWAQKKQLGAAQAADPHGNYKT
jgi:hypothetical protein